MGTLNEEGLWKELLAARSSFPRDERLVSISAIDRFLMNALGNL